MSPPCGRFSWLHLTMLNELRRCGIYDDVAQWQSLDDLLHSLTTFSTCWNYCFPGLPPPSIPVEEYESITQLPWLSLILEVLVVVRIALQIPNCAMSNSHHTGQQVRTSPMSVRCLFIDQFLTTAHFAGSRLLPAVFRSSSLLQDFSLV